MKMKAITYVMEAAMHNIPNKSYVQAALAACLILGAGVVSAADVAQKKVTAPTQAQAASAANASADAVAKEIVTRE